MEFLVTVWCPQVLSEHDFFDLIRAHPDTAALVNNPTIIDSLFTLIGIWAKAKAQAQGCGQSQSPA